MLRNQLLEWVSPAQAGEPSEVPVGGVEDSAILDGQRRQVGVTDQRTASLAIQQHFPEQAPVLVAGGQQTHIRLIHPLINNLDGFLWSEPLSGESWVRDDPKKGRDRLPWQTDRRPIRECLLDPRPSLGVLLRAGIVGVQQQVGVENDHRWSGPSSASI